MFVWVTRIMQSPWPRGVDQVSLRPDASFSVPHVCAFAACAFVRGKHVSRYYRVERSTLSSPPQRSGRRRTIRVGECTIAEEAHLINSGMNAGPLHAEATDLTGRDRFALPKVPGGAGVGGRKTRGRRSLQPCNSETLLWHIVRNEDKIFNTSLSYGASATRQRICRRSSISPLLVDHSDSTTSRERGE